MLPPDLSSPLTLKPFLLSFSIMALFYFFFVYVCVFQGCCIILNYFERELYLRIKLVSTKIKLRNLPFKLVHGCFVGSLAQLCVWNCNLIEAHKLCSLALCRLCQLLIFLKAICDNLSWIVFNQLLINLYFEQVDTSSHYKMQIIVTINYLRK